VIDLQVLASGLLGLCTKIGRGGGVGKVAGEERLEERSEDNLGAAGLRESHPDDEDELESVVEC